MLSLINRIVRPQIIALVLLAAGSATAQAGVDISITWFSINGGGGICSGGDFTVSSTIGQPGAGAMSGGGFELQAGFQCAFLAQPPACPGDIDGDMAVGLSDIAAVIFCWGQAATCDPNADLDGSGTIGLGDIAQVIQYWGSTCEP